MDNNSKIFIYGTIGKNGLCRENAEKVGQMNKRQVKRQARERLLSQRESEKHGK